MSIALASQYFHDDPHVHTYDSGQKPPSAPVVVDDDRMQRSPGFYLSRKAFNFAALTLTTLRPKTCKRICHYKSDACR
jgi:hypothetical protein